MDIFVLVNPASADGDTGQIWPQIAAALEEAGLNFDYHLTTAPFQAPQLVRSALAAGKDTIVAVGGDGTAHEVANGFFDNGQVINAQARLAVLSRGTGCDFIRTLGIPKDCRQGIEVIKNNREKTIDLAQVEYQAPDGQAVQRYMLNIADVGLGAAVCNRVNHTSKANGGFWSFLSGTLLSVLRYRNVDIQVKVDGQVVENGPMMIAAAANGRYFGGGMHLAPPALIDDGKLDCVTVAGMNKPELFYNFQRIYRGTHLTHPKINIYKCNEIEVSGGPFLLELDGEVPPRDATTPVRIVVKPRALKVLC